MINSQMIQNKNQKTKLKKTYLKYIIKITHWFWPSSHPNWPEMRSKPVSKVPYHLSDKWTVEQVNTFNCPTVHLSDNQLSDIQKEEKIKDKNKIIVQTEISSKYKKSEAEIILAGSYSTSWSGRNPKAIIFLSVRFRRSLFRYAPVIPKFWIFLRKAWHKW